MQKKISIRLILSAVVLLLTGVTIAYYNTASFGYDNANVLSVDYDSINIFALEIKFQTVSDIISFLKRFILTYFFVI